MSRLQLQPLLIGIFLFALSLAATSLVKLDPTLNGPISRLELVPYIALLAAALLVPIAVLFRDGRLHILSPLVHVTWTYSLPMLLGGSLLFVAVGVSDIPLDYLLDPAADFRVTLLYLAIGMAALGLGATMDAPYRVGKSLGERLPRLQWTNTECLSAGMTLTLFGTLVQYLNFRSGLIGYQIGSGGAFVALWYYVGLTFQMGIFLVWYAIFRTSLISRLYWISGALTVVCMMTVAVLAGSRGLLPACWIIVVLAFFTVRRRPSRMQLASLALSGCIALGAGFTIGTLFRYVKATKVDRPAVVQINPTPSVADKSLEVTAPAAGSGEYSRAAQTAKPPLTSSEDVARYAQRTVTLRDQTETVGEAINMATSQNLPLVVRSFAARVNVLSQITVLVSQREALYNSLPPTLKSGILIGIATALVPRVIWPSKPVIGDSASHARLFFKFEGNSFAVTPVGDLLLNFGPAGIVPGMIVLGFCMSLLFSIVVASAPLSPARAAIMVALLTQFSIEGFLGPLVPSLIRAGLVGVLAIAIAQCVFYLRSVSESRQERTPPTHRS